MIFPLLAIVRSWQPLTVLERADLAPGATFHRRSPSSAAETKVRPSGVKANQLIGDLWPRRVSNSARVLRCHT